MNREKIGTAIKLTSGVKKTLMPSIAPGRLTPLTNIIISTRYGNMAVI